MEEAPEAQSDASSSASIERMVFPMHKQPSCSTMNQHETLDSFVLKPLSKKSDEKITSALCYFIATEMMPYSLVEKDSFKYFIKALQPNYQVPSRKTISNVRIPLLYDKTREIVEKTINNRYISLTTDCWTSISMEPYISLTAHIINDDWLFESMTLDCKKLTESHTGENLKTYLDHSAQIWGINAEHISVCTTDNGTNNC